MTLLLANANRTNHLLIKGLSTYQQPNHKTIILSGNIYFVLTYNPSNL